MEEIAKKLIEALEVFAEQQKLMFREELDRALKHLVPVVQEDKLIPKAEVQKLYKVSSTTLWNYERSGFLKPVRFKRRVFYRQSDLEKAMK